MSIKPSAPVGGVPPPPPPSLDVAVSITANDPTQRVTVDGAMVRIIGDVSNNGIVQSFITLKVDAHKRVTLPLSGGETPADTQALIAANLPKGYSVRNVPTFAPIDGVLFQIVRDLPAKNDRAYVQAHFAKARELTSLAGEKVSVVELRNIVGEAKKDGFTADEKHALALCWSSLFDGAQFHSTKAAQQEYAKLQQQHGLPQFPRL